ncbi:60S ribosomal protein L31 [Candidatus Woesearchaeota archaeon]|nr:60S ribosomal protein L31 [Candidatus Woesearchaeota archaeon]
MERTYIIPLRREWLKTPKYRRTKKATIAVKDFLKKHMKSDNIKIGRNLNMMLWKHGIKNPPHKIKVSVIKEDDGTVKAELFGHKYEEVKVETKKKEKTKKEELMEKLAGKPKEKKEKPKETPTEKLAEQLEKEEKK